MRRIFLMVLVTCAVACPGLARPAAAQESPAAGGVKAVLELSQRFYYAGDPFFVRISIGNDGDETVKNPVKTPLFKGFGVKTATGEPVPATGTPTRSEPARPEKLSSGSFYGSVVDLTQIYPALRNVGEYEIHWSAEGVSSETIVVKMIPRYDPSKDYTARLETDAGAIVVDFFKHVSPIAVKNFTDLANADFYDGLIFHEVRPDELVVSGDPLGNGTGGAPYTYPAELAAMPVVAGTVLMKPVSPSPPANGSQFIIMLRPEPRWTGQLTVLGQVVEGLEIIRKISRMPSTQTSAQPHFKPLKDLHIRDVIITEKKTPEPPAGTPGLPEGSAR